MTSAIPPVRESKIEAYLHAQVTKRGGKSYKFQSPSNRGVPDRIIVTPRAVWFVEVKREGGKLSKLQELTIRDLAALNANVAIVYGKTDVDTFIERIFNES